MQEFEQVVSDIKAKSCPFCGNKPVLTHITMLGVPHYHRYKMSCNHCLANIALHCDKQEEAIKVWNTRYEPPTPGGAIVPTGNERLK